MDKKRLIVVGGGISGLMAARELGDHFDITILEARSRLGGRIHTLPVENSSLRIEAGAEFIHGNLELTFQLLKEAGIKHVRVDGTMYRREKGEWREQEEMLEGWDEVFKKMKSLESDMTMYDFLQLYFADAKYDDLRRHVTAFAEGFDIADVKKASVLSLYKEWSGEEMENFRIPAGYGKLVDFLCRECESKGCHILTNQTVKQVDWERDEVTVYTTNHKYDAEKAIITVPLRILTVAGAPASINFTPPLDDYIKAADGIGMGEVIKVVLHFKQRFWKEDTGFILSDEMLPTWWTQLPDQSPVLTGWAGGTKAEQMHHHTDKEILEKALFSLSAIFNKTIDDLKDNLLHSYIFNWQTDVHSMGAYSYSMPSSDLSRKILNLPVADTIYFAGEALYEGASPGTVEAALASGKKTAGIIKSNM
jgi:monoamine oxidase